MKETNQLTRILEGILFAAEKPMSVDRLLEVFDETERPEKKQVKEALQHLIEAYAEHGIELKELATGFQFQVRPDLAKWVQRLWEERAPRYSRALLETLALIAYRQPITRSEIEDIRGVAVSSHIVKTLLEREWVRVVGYRDVPGRPSLLATTKEFLDYFGLRSLEELPSLNDIQDLEKLGENLAQQLEIETDNEQEASSSDEEPTEDSPENSNDIAAEEETEEELTEGSLESLNDIIVEEDNAT